MTEEEWLSAAEPTPMLEFLRGKASDRKLRLFAVACCRNVWHLLEDERARATVELAERYADGLASRADLTRATKAIPLPEWPGSGPRIFDWKLVTTGVAADVTDVRTFVWMTGELDLPELTLWSVAVKWGEDGMRFVPPLTQATFLRCIFNPFHPISLNPAWQTSTVLALAQGIYQDRAFDRLQILADALQDASCDTPYLLNHCRSEGPHTRGCWALDLLLGKE